MDKVTILCKKCQEELNPSEFWWDEKGFGYSAKLTKCPHCGAIHILKIIEDSSIDLNKDLRYYEYV